MRTISVVVPVYNGAGSLRPLVDRLEKVLTNLAPDFEIILVNDGSADDSWRIITELAGGCQKVRGINLLRNFGQHNALLCGIRAASFEIIVTVDDDLQHPPEEIPRLLARLDEGYSVVYGTPRQERHGLWRDAASKITKLALQSAMGLETAKKVSAFRAFRSEIRAAFAGYQSPFVSIDVLLTWGTTRFASVPVEHELRGVGQSNYTFRKLVQHALNMMTGFSTLPLQIASMVGFVLTLFGIAVLFWVIGRYFVEGSTAPGFPFLASIISIFSGAQLFALGILGEYLARIHFRTMDRPPYVVGKELERSAMESGLEEASAG